MSCKLIFQYCTLDKCSYPAHVELKFEVLPKILPIYVVSVSVPSADPPCKQTAQIGLLFTEDCISFTGVFENTSAHANNHDGALSTLRLQGGTDNMQRSWRIVFVAHV